MRDLFVANFDSLRLLISVLVTEQRARNKFMYVVEHFYAKKSRFE